VAVQGAGARKTVIDASAIKDRVFQVYAGVDGRRQVHVTAPVWWTPDTGIGRIKDKQVGLWLIVR
jgi:hypothetical protein